MSKITDTAEDPEKPRFYADIHSFENAMEHARKRSQEYILLLEEFILRPSVLGPYTGAAILNEPWEKAGVAANATE